MTLGLAEHLLPVVSNPSATISKDSQLAALGKVPSDYNFRRHARGFPKWTLKRSTMTEVEGWMIEPDYGICVQCREGGVRAIDIDVPDARRAALIRAAIEDALPWHFFPARGRPDSGKILLAYQSEGVQPKRVVPVEGGMVELLGDGQQFIAVGTHTGGQRYAWEGGMPEAFPRLDSDDVEALWATLLRFATGEPTIARVRRRVDDMEVPDVDDPMVDWLLANWEVHDADESGTLHILCPFDHEHTTQSGVTATSYFPAGAGGYEQGHFVCLHAHCAARDDSEYRDALGYTAQRFPLLEPEQGVITSRTSPLVEAEPERPWPRLVRDSKGAIEATADNMTKLIERADVIGWRYCYDAFRGEIIKSAADEPFEEAQWKPFTDADYVHLRIALERKGVKPMGKEMLRDCLHAVAVAHEVDLAQLWLDRLEWDGVERIERFFPEYLGTADTAYTRSMGLYAWTAHAGRVIEPGVKADMVPVLIGEQGIRKSSAIEAISPLEQMFAIIDLHKKDDDLSRIMRGVLVGELAELRGLAGREAEAIKELLVRRHEKWIPKFKEMETTYPRRLLLWGTGNNEGFLSDTTGNRRWLPVRVDSRCDTGAIVRDRAQLWAEGAARFKAEGVIFYEAERLARDEHDAFVSIDPWQHTVEAWLGKDVADLGPPSSWEHGLDVQQVASGALNLSVRDVNKLVANRVIGVLKALGYRRSSKAASKNRYIKVAE